MPRNTLWALIVAVAACGCLDKSTQTSRTVASSPVKKTYSREEFKALVMGKTEKEVIDALGKPDRTSPGEFGTYWYYEEKTVDPINGKVDRHAQIVFRNGIVEKVSY